MKLGFQALENFKINTNDKENAAKLVDFLFDEETFDIKYIVAHCGSWLFGDKVLIVPSMLKSINPNERSLFVDVDTETLKGCPSRNRVDTISEDLLSEMGEYYPNYDPYYNFAGWGHIGSPLWTYSPDLSYQQDLRKSRGRPGEDRRAPKLRSAKEVLGYKALSDNEKEVGKVKELILDVKAGQLRYFVVDTGSWLNSKEFLVAIDWLKSFDAIEMRIRCALSEKAIESCPAYKANEPINQSLETRLYDFHGRPYYWWDASRTLSLESSASQSGAESNRKKQRTIEETKNDVRDSYTQL